jgi:hypothetical protein
MRVKSNLNRRKGRASVSGYVYRRSKKHKRWGNIKYERSIVRKSKVIGILTASSLAYFGEPVIGRLRGVLSGEGVEGCHVNDVSRILRRKLGVAVSRGVRRFVGSLCVGEIAH